MSAAAIVRDRRVELGPAGWLAAFLLVAWIPALSFAGHWSFDEPSSTSVPSTSVPSTSDVREMSARDHAPGQDHTAAAQQQAAAHQQSAAAAAEPGANPDDVSHAEHGHAGPGASLLVMVAPAAPLATPVPVRTFDAAAHDDATLTGFESIPPALPPR